MPIKYIDGTGRIVIPKNIREESGLKIGVPIRITSDEARGRIILESD